MRKIKKKSNWSSKVILLILAFLILLILGSAFFAQNLVSENAGDLETGKIRITNGIQHSVPLSSINTLIPKDAIASIDNPKFISVKEADKFLNDEGFGISVSINGMSRFYANQILVWHEIVNDEIAGQPVLITYCPLCATGIVFEPIVNGESSEFGTSGKLWNSNLVMYDRNTRSLWSQVLGEAIVGEMTGQSLKLLAHENIQWKNWKAANPNGEVLSRETGYFRDYSGQGSPYGDYDTNEQIAFPVDNIDERYHSKEITFGIIINGEAKVYAQSELKKTEGTFVDRVAGEDLFVTYNHQNDTLGIFKDDGTEIVSVYGFWFSWMAAHPESEVYVYEESL